jgi:superfamily II DNA/RNA helicase
LRQWRVIASAEEKPLALLALLQELSGAPTIVFAGSVRASLRGVAACGPACRDAVAACVPQVEATHRLFLMLQACDSSAPARCVEYSSLQSHADRTRALEAFRAQHATVLVASDAATRGLDVEVRACSPACSIPEC